MKTKKTVPKTRATPREAVLEVPLCFNCDEPMEKPDLFCNQLCADEASFVRSVRKWRQQGRDKDADIRETIDVLQVHLLNGGYPKKERELPLAVRQAVKDRAKGMCEALGCGNPGAEIDHIHGSSPDLGNLQYLYHECHMKKTRKNFKPLTPEHPRYDEFMEKILRWRVRYVAKKPLRPCDDHETWSKAWSSHKQERKVFFAAKAEPILF